MREPAINCISPYALLRFKHTPRRPNPLPFIADDLLVHFDDTRAAAAIALLAELGQTAQVILFTHHDHIAALAERQDGVGIQILPPITNYAAAMPVNA